MNSITLPGGNLGIPGTNQAMDQRAPLPSSFPFFGSNSGNPLLPPFFNPAVAAAAIQNLAHLTKSQPPLSSASDQSLMKSAMRLPPIPLHYHPQYRLPQISSMIGNALPPPGFGSTGASLPANFLSMKGSDLDAKYKSVDHLTVTASNPMSFEVNTNSFISNKNPHLSFPFADLPHDFAMFTESMGGPPGCFPSQNSATEPTTKKKKDQMKSSVKRKCSPTQIPSFNFIFNKGAPIKLTNGTVKVIEDLSINDFLESVCDNPNYQMKTSRVVAINPKVSAKTVCITFAVGKSQSKIDLEVNICQPFFVVDFNCWASCNPELSKLRYNLDCKPLQVGRECLVLIKDNKIVKNQPKAKHPKDSFLMEDLIQSAKLSKEKVENSSLLQTSVNSMHSFPLTRENTSPTKTRDELGLNLK